MSRSGRINLSDWDQPRRDSGSGGRITADSWSNVGRDADRERERIRQQRAQNRVYQAQTTGWANKEALRGQVLQGQSDMEKALSWADFYANQTLSAAKTGNNPLYDEGYLRYKEAMAANEEAARLQQGTRAVEDIGDKLTGIWRSDYANAERSAGRAASRATEDTDRYARMAESAATIGDKKGYQQAVEGYNAAIGDYAGAYADYIGASVEANQKLKAEAPGLYYASTMSREELQRKVDELQNQSDLVHGIQWTDGMGGPASYKAEAVSSRVQALDDELALYKYALKQKTVWDNESRLSELTGKMTREDGSLQQGVAELAAAGRDKFNREQETKQKEFSAKVETILSGDMSGVSAGDAEYDPSRPKEFSEMGPEEGHLDQQQKQIFYALYAKDPETAREYLTLAQEKAETAYYQKISDFTGSNVVTQWYGMQLAALSGLISGFDPYGQFGQNASKMSEAITRGGVEAWNEVSGTLSTDKGLGKFMSKVPVLRGLEKILDGKGLGDLYSLGVSMEQSGMVALASAAVGDYGDTAVAVAEFLGTALMGSSAGASDYRECIAAGMTRDQAIRHASAAAMAEAAFEYISIDKLVNQDVTRGFIKNFFLQGGIEASEEVCTTIANRISDGYLAWRDGYDTSVEQRTKELIAMGVDRSEAEKQAEREWLTDLINDGIGGFLSGGGMTAMHTIDNIDSYLQARKERNQQLESYGATVSADEGAALQSYAEANGIDFDKAAARGLEAREAQKAAQEQRQAQEGNAPEAEASPEAQNDSEKKSRREQRQERKSNRSLAETREQVISQIAENLRQSGLNNAQTIYEEQVSKHGEGITRSVQAAVAREAANTFQPANSQEDLNAKYQQAVEGVTAKPIRDAIQSAYTEATASLALRGDQSAFGRLVQQYGNSKGSMNLDVQVKGENGAEQTAQIVGVTNNAESVKLSNGQTVKVSELAGIDADTKDVLDRIAYMEVGAAAGNMWQAFQIGAEKRTTADNYRWIMDYTTAFDQGRVGKLSLNEAISRSSLDSDIVRMAYELGQQAAKEQTAADKRKLDEKRKAVKPGATGKKGILDTSAISEQTMKGLSRQHRQQLQIIEKIAEALGVDVVLYDSTVKDGKYTGANGWYDPKTGEIHLDINAGRNSIRDIGSGILAVTGHELTHWMQQYAPEQYAAYRDAVVKALVAIEGDTGFEYLVDKARRDSTKKLTRTQAIDEVVADASMERVGDEDFWNAMADSLGEEKQGVVAKIREFFQQWFAKIREALAGSPHMSEAARAVDRAEAQVQKALSKLFAEGISEAARTAREIGADATTLGASEQMIEDALVQHSDRIDKETLKFLNEQEHVTVYRAMQLIDGELYPPMAAKVKDENGKLTLVEPTKLGQWYQAVERPELIDPKTGKWRLNKGNGTAIDAAYNPYFHSSASPLNDQFSSAYKRDNLVVVEGKIPSSELTSGYKAQYAKDTVGETKWHSGPVASKLKGDKARRVFLSRWFQAVRVMSNEEVARIVAKTLEGEDVSVPSNVVTPGLLEALRAEGVRIEEKNAGRKFSSRVTDKAYLELAKDPQKNEAELREMVFWAAIRNRYTPVERYHQTDAKNDFTKFSTDNPQAGKYDSETPNGIFLKTNDHFVPLGMTDTAQNTKQMPLFIRTENVLRFADRTEANRWYCENIDGYEALQNELTEKLKGPEQKLDDLQNEWFKAAEIDDWDAVEAIEKREDVVKNEADAIEKEYRAKQKKLLDDYFLTGKSGYDAIELKYDGHRYADGKREDVHTFIVFDPTQVKSADPVTYDNSGNVIPLSERFNKGNEDIRYSERDTDQSPVQQEISSWKTSIKQIPALFTDKRVKFGNVNVDIGGGRFDLATNYLKENGTKNLVFDPYNRSKEVNSATLKYLQNGNRADTATCANVLNVIAEPAARANVILETAKAIKPGGTAYFMVYEGDGSGVGKKTSSGWQNNRKTADYVSEIEQYFDNVERKGKLIVATDPKANLPQASWEVQPGEAVRYSERDYSQKSDLELMAEAAETLSEAGGEEYWKALLDSVPELAENEGGVKSRMQEIKRLAQKLSETEKKLEAAKADMKPTDRKLNTAGISAMVKDAMKNFEITDAKKNGIVQKATQALIDGYQQALDAIDAGKSDQIPDITYNAAVKAAEILLTEGRHTENHGGKWSNTTAERYLGEDRQQLIDHMVSAVGADFALNRYRKAIQGATADRLISRTKNEMQKKLDAQKEKGEALTAENAKLSSENEWLKAAADSAKEQVGSLNDQLQYLKEKMQDAGKLSTKEKTKLRQQARNLNKRLQAAKEEAKAWKTRAEQEGKLATQYGEKQAALIKKLEDQKAKKQAILEGKLKPLPMQRMLRAVRKAEAEKVKQHKDEVFARYKENQKQAQLRSRIRNLSDEMKRTMTKPTDGSYVPAALYGSMTKLADALDSLLAPNDGTKAAARYRAVMDQIHALSAEYRAVQNMDDPVYSSEYDDEIQYEIDEIVKILQGANADEVGTLKMTPAKIRELNTEELQKVYNILKYINWSMKTAKDMMSSGQFRSVYDAMTSIVEQQRALRSAASMGWLGRTKRSRMLDSLNVMRAVEMMSNWDRSAALYQIMHQVEQGVVKSDAWMMDYNKSLQDLKTGKNEKAYRDALTKKLDYSVTDEEGLPVKMTKMQAIQILMTAEREAGNDKLVHLQKGGAVIRDALKIQDGKVDKAGGQTIQVTPELLQRIQDSLTEWDRVYMKAVRAYLAKEGRATNQVMYALKHRVLETEPNYVPYIVDKNYLDTDLNEKQAMNMWVKTPGSTNALKQKASQPVIIDGMDTVMAKHVKEIADYIGMALPIRDFSKVYNGKLKKGEGENPLPVKKLIDRNWEKKGLHLLTQSIIDVQGGSRSNSWSTAIAEHLNALQSAFVKSALLINPSVTIKQAASYAAAGSILSHKALDLANHPVLLNNDVDASKAMTPGAGLIGHIFAAPNGKTATRIYNEIDKYTSMHYQRRQGMSQYELANEANRSGPIRRATNAVGASMEQNVFGHAARKVGASLNPVSWIQRMDVATTATLWLACKEQARMDGMEVGSAEYWQRTTELYERVLRETQPMYDSLHRNAFQKGQGLFQYLFPFRTVPIQNHGQLAAAYETWRASKDKSKAEQKAAAKFFRKTAWAQTESAIVFSLMTFIAAALKRKTKKYRDEDEELGLGSVLKGIGTDTAGTLFSVLMPVMGSELWNVGSRLAGKFEGSSGYTYDAFSVGVVDLLNDLAGSFDKIAADLGKMHRGEDASEFWNHGLTMLLKAAKLAGIPADTIKTYWEGIRGNAEDIAAGRIPALNDESWERSAAVNAERYVKALEAGDSGKVDAVEAEMLQDYADAGKSEEEAAKALKTKLTSTLKEKYESGGIEAQDAVDLLVETGFYDENDAWKKVKEWEVKAGHKGETDYHYSQYDEMYEAMDKNGDATKIVKDLEDNGVDPDSVKSAAKGHLIDRYMAGEISSTQVKNQLSRYCGIVGTDATNLVRWLDLRKAKPELEVTQAQCNSWYDGSSKSRENGHESAKAAGMSIEQYLEAKAVLDEINDSNGNGTGEDEVIAALAKMKLTSRQKDALYYERYKGTTKYSVKKW